MLSKKCCFYRIVAGALLGMTVGIPAESRVGYIENQSYPTLCAEIDNVNIPVYAPGATAFRIVASHPAYYPTTINETGADWTDCDFTDRSIWVIGEKNGSHAGFKQSGYSDDDIHYAPDNPPAGMDEPASEFPREINNDNMKNQYIRFTADEPGDFNLTLIIGAFLEVAFTEVTGTLEIEMRTGDGIDWESQGVRTFNSVTRIQQWDIPDFTWIEGIDANHIHLRVTENSSADAQGLYDYLELHKRHEGGETVTLLYNDGQTQVDSVHIDFWWRAPLAMHIDVIGGATHTNTHYLRMIRRIPGTESEWAEIFVLYQDCNARIIPLPPAGGPGVPYGSSVQIGATPESERPYADIKEVTVNPLLLTLDVTYQDDSTAHIHLDADRERHIVQVTDISYDTATLPITRLRSMWVRDGNADIGRVLTSQGAFPIMDEWETLDGFWWFFFRDTPSYHNTYCPDFLIEILDPDPAFLVRDAESFNHSAGITVVDHADAESGQVAVFDAEDAGEVTYHLDLSRPYWDAYALIRYADATGGRALEFFLNNTPADSLVTVRTGGTNDFHHSPAFYLGPLDAGSNTVRISSGMAEETPLLLNPSFEDGTEGTAIYHWPRWDGIVRDNAAWVGPRTGEWALLWQGWTDGGGIYQNYSAHISIGATYTFSIWGDPTSDWINNFAETRMFIEFRDALDEPLLVVNFTDLDDEATDTWTRYSVQGAAPGGTVSIRVGLAFGDGNGAGAFRFDDAELVGGAPASGPLLDTIRLFARPEPLMEEVVIAEITHDADELTLNPSFEDGTDSEVINHWTQTGGMVREQWGAQSGVWSLVWQGWTSAGDVHQDVEITIQAGDAFTFSIWGNPTWDWDCAFEDTRMYMHFLDGDGESLHAVVLTEFDHRLKEYWRLYFVQGLAPVGAETIRVGLAFGDGNGDGAFRFDDASLTRAATPTLSEPPLNTYLTIRYAEEEAPTRVDLIVNGVHAGTVPTENTGGSAVFDWSPMLYLGELEAESHVIGIIGAGLNMDQFRLVTRRRVNRPPVLAVPSPHTLVMGSTTNFGVVAYDLDDDPVEITMTDAPAGALFDDLHFEWSAVPGFGGTTQTAVFVATDAWGDTNSWVTNTAIITVPYDWDDDGLPDDWEWIHFATLDYGPNDDVDGDRVNNYGHLIAGTNPNDAQSFFHAHHTAMGDEGAVYEVTVSPTMPGRLYTIYYTDANLSDNPQVWLPFNNTNNRVGTWIETNVTASTFTFRDHHDADTTGGPPAHGVRLYRVEVEWPEGPQP